MPETVTEKGVAPQAQEAREKSQAAHASEPKQDAHGVGAHGGAYTLFRELTAASSAQEPPPDKLSPIFRKSEFSHPVNDEQKARSLAALQQQYGNRYVQRVLSPDTHTPSAPLARRWANCGPTRTTSGSTSSSAARRPSTTTAWRCTRPRSPYPRGTFARSTTYGGGSRSAGWGSWM